MRITTQPPAISPKLMRAFGWKAITAVLICAALFRSWGAFDYPGYAGDEGIIITAAKSVSAYGTSDWKNPQLCFFIISGAMKLFGDNPVGWRICGIALGTASVLLLYLIARILYPERYIPLLAATLLAFDPFDIHFCRTALMEPIAVFFFLLFLLLMLEYTENGRKTLTASGIAMGCAIATKAYFLFAIAVVIAYAFCRRYQHERNILALGTDFTIKLLLLPLSLYLVTFLQWFGRGYDLIDLFRLRYDAYWIYNNGYRFYFEDILSSGGKPWEWFIKPFSFGHQFFSDGQYGRFSIEINNPHFRMLVLPAIGITLFHALKKRCWQEMLAPLLFAACYALFFTTKRPFNSYSSLPMLPFAYLTLAHATTILAQRYDREQEATLISLLIIILSGIYLFPLIAGLPVPLDFYKSVLSITKLSKVM